MSNLSHAALKVLTAVIQERYGCNPDDMPRQASELARTLGIGLRHAIDDYESNWDSAALYDHIDRIAEELDPLI